MTWVEYREGHPDTFPSDGEDIVVWRFMGFGVAAKMVGRAYVRASLDRPFRIDVGVAGTVSMDVEEVALDDLGWGRFDGPVPEVDRIFWRPATLDPV